MSRELRGTALHSSHRGRKILRGVDLVVRSGEMVALTGPSGSGKSTLLALLAGLEAPDAGTVRLDGEPVTAAATALRRRIGVVFQGYALVALLTAAENVELPLMASGHDTGTAAERAREALAAVGLAERTGHLVEELSGGQQQRVAIARALAGRPEVLLVDEPSAEQDAVHRDAILRALVAAARGGVAVLVATHDADVAQRCDRRLQLVDGEFGGTPEVLA